MQKYAKKIVILDTLNYETSTLGTEIFLSEMFRNMRLYINPSPGYMC